MGRLLSLNVGQPRDISWKGRSVRTAIWKFPVAGRRMVRALNVDGDGQADLVGHGGEHRAVFVYQQESYRYWERFLNRDDFKYGQFGENFTAEGLADAEVCIGDKFRIGGAVVEVTQPRVTCYRLGIRMNEPRMPALLVAHRRPGFYLRVLQEGEVGAGDDIVKISGGPEKITVADVDALLYLPGHSREQLERALRVPALSKGWQSSFRAMLNQETVSNTGQGNAGLAREEPTPAWPGFQRMRVTQVQKESDSVTSFSLTRVDGQALPVAQAGQFVVLRLQINPQKPPVIRSYSLSGLPGSGHFRISVKSDGNGVGSSFLCDQVRKGYELDVSAPRGSFTLRPSDNPVVLLSAGVGATPVISMLHALAADRSSREVWWIYGTRNRANHPFVEETDLLLKRLPCARSHIMYSRPAPTEQQGRDFDSSGRMEVSLLEKIGVPQSGDFYLCGPASFLENMRRGIRTWGVPGERIYEEAFGARDGATAGAERTHRPHLPHGQPKSGPAISFARSGIAGTWDPAYKSLLEFAEACDVSVRWSCRTGVCHLCITGLVSGSIRYQPEPLEEPTAGNVLICCSQPDASVVLDL